MTDKAKAFLSAVFGIILCLIMATILSLIVGCKPDIPIRSDYPSGMYPCYIADVCVRMTAYSEGAKQDCTLALQKCFRYTDYDKCRDADSPVKCWEWLGVRL